jgi:rhodanese-related sulfurtransferase
MPSPRFKSMVTATEPAAPEVAHRHFAAKLEVETDPSDVHFDLTHGNADLVVVDARSPESWAERRVPGAVSLPHARIDAASVEPLRGRGVAVVYCWAASCNAATKAAARLTALGLRVKEMIGGLEAWVHEGYPTEGSLPSDVTFEQYLRAHHAPAPRR